LSGLGFNLRASIGNYAYNAFAADNATVMAFRDQGFVNNLYEGIYRTGFKLMNDSQQRASDYFLENASFLKLDNITLGYSFDRFFTNRISGRINFAVQNVLTITNYTGLDPEVQNNGYLGIDYNIWPRPLNYTLGISFNL
jgi:iron complex outermembrane receptor protein